MFRFSPRSLSLVVWALAGVFFTRTVFNVLTACGVVDIDTSRDDVATEVRAQ